MVVRRRQPAAGVYFPEHSLEFVSSGCTVLDCVLGGGWPLGRISNIVGDKSAGKTLLAIEACANFHHQHPRGHIWYREAEAAFDEGYAAQLGLPVGGVDFGPEGVDTNWETIEDIFEDLEQCVSRAEETGQPGLYVVDSLDALSSRSELKRGIDEGSYRMEKPRVAGELFRRLRKRLKRARVALMIVSQIRDKIGITFGEKHTRTGGKALDFYASQILWLHHKAIIKKTAGGVERAIGVRVRAKNKKNKVAPPFRECEFALIFGYGVDDLEASVLWLDEHKFLGRLDLTKKDVSAYLRRALRMEGADMRQLRGAVSEVVRSSWHEVEERFRPQQSKYG